MTTSQNLSEQLFKSKFDYPETSTLVQRIAMNSGCHITALDKEPNYKWYRIVTEALWHWRGLPAEEITSVLSRIRASTKSRTNDKWLDTVAGYQSGNWIYEFLAQSSVWQIKADSINKNSISEQDKQNLHHGYLMASEYASIASYPHYKNDKMALYAQTRAYKLYYEALNYSSYITKEIEVKIGNGSIKGILHLPNTNNNQPSPVVLICSGLGNLQIDFYRYFHDYLAPKGIALLTIDTPSVGYSCQYHLTQDSSRLYQKVVEMLPSVPWVDSRRVILAGFRFGSQIAMRLAYLMPNKIKAVINFKPIIHQVFVNENLQQNLPTMYKDMLASRLGLSSVSNQRLAAELKCFSLKNQGIINKPCNLPVMTILVDDDKFSSTLDAELIQSTKKHKIITVKKHKIITVSRKQSLQEGLTKSVAWLSSIL